MNAERTRKLARCFAAEWLRPNDPDHATETLVETLATTMTAFYAAARSADERHSGVGEPAEPLTDAVDRAHRWLKWQDDPRWEKCPRCDGRGYHHGFGEKGVDPDWCLECGGPGEVPTEEGTWAPEDIVRDLLTELAQVEAERDAAQNEVRMGHVRLDECADAAETQGRPLYDRISAKIQQLAEQVEEQRHLRLAVGAEKDELRSRAEAAEHRRAAAEYRAQRIVLDAELKAELDAAQHETASLREALEHLADDMSRASWPTSRLPMRERWVKALRAVLAGGRGTPEAK